MSVVVIENRNCYNHFKRLFKLISLMLQIFKLLIDLLRLSMISLVFIPVITGIWKATTRLCYMKIRSLCNKKDVNSFRSNRCEADSVETLLGDHEEIIVQRIKDGAGFWEKIELRLKSIGQIAKISALDYVNDLQMFCMGLFIALDLSETNRKKGFNNTDTQLKLSQLTRNHPHIKINMSGVILAWNSNAECVFKPCEPFAVGTDSVSRIIPSIDSDGIDLELFVDKLCINPIKYRLNVNENILCCNRRDFRLWINILEADNLGLTIHCISLPIRHPKIMRLSVRLYNFFARL